MMRSSAAVAVLLVSCTLGSELAPQAVESNAIVATNVSNASNATDTTNGNLTVNLTNLTEEFTIKQVEDDIKPEIDPNAPGDIPSGIWRADYKYEPKILENPEDSKFILRPQSVGPEDITLDNPGGSFTLPTFDQKQDARIPVGPRQQHMSRGRACACCYKYATKYGKEPNCATGLCTCNDPVTNGKYCFSDLGVESFRDGTEPEACKEEDMLANMCDYV